MSVSVRTKTNTQSNLKCGRAADGVECAGDAACARCRPAKSPGVCIVY